VTVAAPEEFVYRDKKLGDTAAVTVATDARVFHPTSTSVLLLRVARQALQQPCRSVLDLGCGCGIVAVVLAQHVASGTSVSASDLSAAAADLTRRNAERNGVDIEVRAGSLFEPWVGRRFDLIVDDVAGVAEPLARVSGWYPADVPSEAGRDGTRWIVQIIDQATDYLTPGGRLVFPVLTLSAEERILERARARFDSVTLVEEQWYPFSESLAASQPLIDALAAEGNIHIEKHGSRWCWATKIYIAQGPQ
jgi:16S rRNA G1207 methylase RsmC